MAGVVFSDIATEGIDLQGALFAGLRFWLAQRVPQRSRFVADIKANGGEIVLLDKQADVRIVDHARKEVLPGTHSYTFIEQSIRNGELATLEDHTVGPRAGTVRSIGSTVQPAKGSRNKFTQEDDRILWQWVQNTPQKYGGTDGNEIYKQLEAHNSRHPWQSWRDRWIKQLKGKQRLDFIPSGAPPTPPSDHPPPQADVEMLRTRRKEKPSFSDDDKEALLNQGEDIMNLHPEMKEAAWEKWVAHSESNGRHSAQEWEDLWEHHVRPIYLERCQEVQQETATATSPPDQPVTSPIKAEARASTTRLSTPRKLSIGSASPSNLSKLTSSPHFYRRSTLLLERTPQRTGPVSGLDVPTSDPFEVERDDNDQLHNHDEERSLFRPTHKAIVASLRSESGSGREGSGSPKRKRDVFDEDAIPSSSPPSSPLPMFASIKRQRLDEIKHRPMEIASTPENSPTHMNSRLTSGTLNDVQIELADTTHDDSSGDELSSSLGSQPLGRQASPTLSSPTRVVSDTQAAFQEPTQLVDLEVPPPGEGWYSEGVHSNPKPESDPNTQLVVFDDDYTVPESQPTLPDTQALLDSRTQIPEFDIAEPDGGWDTMVDLMPSSPPPPSKERSPSPPVASMNDWVGSQVALGYHRDDAITALRVTNTVENLAQYVLVYMKGKGKGRIPQNQPGVWTDIDDADLQATDARRVERVHKKHGQESCDDRWRFLTLYKA